MLNDSYLFSPMSIISESVIESVTSSSVSLSTSSINIFYLRVFLLGEVLSNCVTFMLLIGLGWLVELDLLLFRGFDNLLTSDYEDLKDLSFRN